MIMFLLNLLNKLWRRDKMRGLQSISLLYHNEFNKFNNTGALMLDFIYCMLLTLPWNCLKVLSLCTQHCYGPHYIMLQNI